MANHVGQIMRIHGSILLFTEQGLEKLNDVYFGTANHKGTAALQQNLENHNRLEHLKDQGIVVPKHHHVTGSTYGKGGHNKLTCPNN